MNNDDLWERAGHPGSIDDNDLVKASQDVPITREELCVESIDDRGLKTLDEGFDFIFGDTRFKCFIAFMVGIAIGVLIMMIPE